MMYPRAGVSSILLLALALPGAVGCNQLEGSGEIHGTLNLVGCDDVTGGFSMDLDFFAIERFGERGLEVRLQNGGRGLEVSDALLLTLYDVDEVIERRGEELAVKPLDLERKGRGEYVLCAPSSGALPRGCPLVRADLNLPTRCPREVTAPLLQGMVVFTHLGTMANDRVAGSFELEAIAARSQEVIGELIGRFNFIVRQGHPYQRFIE
ncbi:MAG: hypothetical protein FJ125_18625 [Deltaproteobacteria bacterium]|nr:hypothetical protein [Deltaproteobacteria bacterium]